MPRGMQSVPAVWALTYERMLWVAGGGSICTFCSALTREDQNPKGREAGREVHNRKDTRRTSRNHKVMMGKHAQQTPGNEKAQNRRGLQPAGLQAQCIKIRQSMQQVSTAT